MPTIGITGAIGPDRGSDIIERGNLGALCRALFCGKRSLVPRENGKTRVALLPTPSRR